MSQAFLFSYTKTSATSAHIQKQEYRIVTRTSMQLATRKV